MIFRISVYSAFVFPLFRIFVFALTQRRAKVGCSAFISPVLLFGQREVRGRRLMMIKRAVSNDLQILNRGSCV